MKTASKKSAGLFVLAFLFFGTAWNPFVHAAPKAGEVQVQAQAAGPVNVNTADAKDLERIKGIGPELASRIVSYREEHGAFKSVDELLSVRGIGQVKLEKIKSEVTL
ncbi:MAG TPA: helix-hairpin-helix domain-containing protein [Verrucomicrobiae bacterium]|jgi:competence protein ComEA|nr:helix-hairpin-helix domain-containing protein [Verrucomicrobiae bacterium]